MEKNKSNTEIRQTVATPGACCQAPEVATSVVLDKASWQKLSQVAKRGAFVRRKHATMPLMDDYDEDQEVSCPMRS